MAIRSPGLKREFAVIVWWISVSKMVIKQLLQSFWWFLGRMITARSRWHQAHGVGGIINTKRRADGVETNPRTVKKWIIKNLQNHLAGLSEDSTTVGELHLERTIFPKQVLPRFIHKCGKALASNPK